ncbi:hypothetical protein UNPF46_14020 [Bradyrhizobium sp. UNPF46]|nr:hypothetical protein UNPF46_14020 [Bradyrhizobium sp. UNPF46]
MVMMAHRMTMTMTMAVTAPMAALGQRRACQCEAGRNDQRRSEREFLHDVLHRGERTCPFNERSVGRLVPRECGGVMTLAQMHHRARAQRAME